MSYGERSHTIAFTERGANLYTKDTIDSMAGTIGLEPILTESKSVVLPLHYAPTVLVPHEGIEPPPRRS